MDNNHIHILSISETHFNQNQAEYLYHKDQDVKAYVIINNISQQNGLGVGIVIHKNYEKYVHKHGSFGNNVIYIDMFMKGHVKIRVIQVYIPATYQYNIPVKQY